MKKMILFLIIGGIAVFCQLHNHGGLLVDAGILFGLIGIVMLFDKVKPVVEWLKGIKVAKERKAGERKVKVHRRIRGRPGIG